MDRQRLTVRAALVVTAPALPEYTGVSPIVPPQNSKFKDFSIIKHWGNLSPYHSVKSHGLPSSSQIVPKGCELEQMHWLQRHGARYPTTNPNGPAGLATRLKAAKFKASGKLKFLNDWDYKLGAELLTPFGRSQLYNLGVSARIKYGFLLDRMNGTKPVFRTESQDRMLRSAQNFAAGFFGIPDEDQYNLLVMIEAPGFNCSLAPYHSCPNDNKLYPNVNAKLATWDFIYLKDARKRLQKMVKGYDITIQDARDMVSCAFRSRLTADAHVCVRDRCSWSLRLLRAVHGEGVARLRVSQQHLLVVRCELWQPRRPCRGSGLLAGTYCAPQ